MLNYPDVKALDSITLDFKKQQFNILLGLSGSGKTSLLRILNLLTTSARLCFSTKKIHTNSKQARLTDTMIDFENAFSPTISCT